MQPSKLLILIFLPLFMACKSQQPVSVNSIKDTTLLSYHRSGCYGFCPVYQVQINKSGLGKFIGIRYVAIMDSLDFKLNPASMAEIETIRQSQEYKDLVIDETDPMIVDAASIYYKDFENEKENLIKGVVPNPIKAIIAIVDRQLKELEFIPGKDETALVQEEIIVQIKPNQPLHSINGEYKTFSLVYLKSLGQDIALYRMIVIKNKMDNAFAQIKQMPDVVEVQKNHKLSPR